MRQPQPFLYHGQPFTPSLTVVGDKIQCVIKGYPRPANPEEYVRQEVLHFLKQLQATYPIRVEVETWERFDVAVYVNYPEKNFAPYIPPVLIVETKHAEHRLTPKDEQQLRGYLAVSQCDLGLLTNRGTSYLCERNGKYTPCTDLAEVEKLVSKRSKVLSKRLKQQHAAFKQAHSTGSLESFKQLAETFGRDTRTMFQFALHDDMGTWTGNDFEFDEATETCDFRPQNAIRSRKQFSYREFERLRRITLRGDG